MDHILDTFLLRQEADWEAFAGQTDLVSVTRQGTEVPCRKFVAEFATRGLIWQPGDQIVEADHFVVGIYFGDDHLRRLNPMQLVWLLSPPTAFHPNILFPTICVGHLRPGVGLIEVLYQVHSILSYQNSNTADFLNPAAAAWAREHRDRFPIDRRPLRRREFHLDVKE